MWRPPKVTHEELIAKRNKDPEFRAAYAALEDEFAVLDAALTARKTLNLSQSDVARRMGLPRSSVCRLERGLAAGRMPTLSMLHKYAQAVGKKVEIRLI